MTTRPVLTLDTIAPERPFVVIDGQPYDLALPDDFGVIEMARFNRLVLQVQEFSQAKVDEADLKAAERVSALLDEAVALILHAPAEVRARLRDGQKAELMEAFRRALPKMAGLLQRPTTRRRTTGSSRRASARSTGPTSG